MISQHAAQPTACSPAAWRGCGRTFTGAACCFCRRCGRWRCHPLLDTWELRVIHKAKSAPRSRRTVWRTPAGAVPGRWPSTGACRSGSPRAIACC
jgi:hypothetical protein